MSEANDGRRKGGVIRAAKARVVKTGVAEIIEEYGCEVVPTFADSEDGAEITGTLVLKLDRKDDAEQDRAPTLVEEIQGYMALGLSEEDALTLAQSKRKAAELAAAPAGIQEAQAAADAAGPDPKLVAEYQRRMADYVPPQLTESYEVEVKRLFADWVVRWANWQSVQRRGREVTPSMAIAMMVAEHWQNHAQDRALLTGSKTGPADAFNPMTGTYDR